jgi:VWFA-related protein
MYRKKLLMEFKEMDSDPKQAAILRSIHVRKQRSLTTWMLLTSTTVLLSVVDQSHFGRPLSANSYSPWQQSQRPNTIRVQVNLVPVDVIATTENGRPVTDLKKDDFRIFENGREQEIRHFSIQTLTPAAPEPPPTPAAVGPLDLAPQSARTFLILMGRGFIQRPFGAVDKLIQFVRKDLLPQDRVAVFAYNRATAFTTDHEAIAQVLERYKPIHERIESWFMLRDKSLAAIYGDKTKMPEAVQPEIDKIFAIRNESVARHIPSGQSKDNATMTIDAIKVLEEALIPSSNPSRNEFTKIESDMITDLPFDEFVSTSVATFQDMRNLYTCIRYMRYMPGEKHLLFFTPIGLFLPRLEYEDSLAAYANDARVAIDTFHTGGTFLEEFHPGNSSSALSFSRTFALSSLRSISELTGGRASIRDYVDKALNRVNEGTRAMYLLGYYPKDENWNGKYRRIDVKVRRPGVKVAFRHGYIASERIRSASQEEIMVASRISAALGYAPDVGDIPFQFTVTDVIDALAAPTLRVDVKVDAAKVGLKNVDGIYSGKLHAAAFAADDKGRVVGQNLGEVDIKFIADDYREIMDSGINFSITVPRKSSRQVLKIIVYDPATDRLGSKLQRFGK